MVPVREVAEKIQLVEPLWGTDSGVDRWPFFLRLQVGTTTWWPCNRRTARSATQSIHVEAKFFGKPLRFGSFTRLR